MADPESTPKGGEFSFEPLSPGAIIDLKDRLKADRDLIPKVAVHIGYKLADEEDPASREFDSTHFATRVAAIAVDTNEVIHSSVKLPADEWLLDGAAPRLCLEVLQRIEQDQLVPSRRRGAARG